MNARLTSIGFYITCIIFFGFQSKPLMQTNNTFPTSKVVGQKSPSVQGETNPILVETEATGNKKVKQSGQFSSQTQECR